ncbi:hypothetical protein [Methylobacterium brachiatum]
MMLPRRTASARGLPVLFFIGSMLVSPIPANAGDPSLAVPDEANSSAWDTLLSGMAQGWSDFTAVIGAVHLPEVSPGPVIVETRMACRPAAVGGPADCGAAVATVCNHNGFKSGSHLDIETGEVCRGDQLIALRNVSGVHCKPKTWTTRVMCW